MEQSASINHTIDTLIQCVSLLFSLYMYTVCSACTLCVVCVHVFVVCVDYYLVMGITLLNSKF